MKRSYGSAVCAVMLAACASATAVPPPGAAIDRDVPPMPLVETPASARPANEIPESQRIKWFEEQRPKAEVVERPVVVEREVIVREPVRYVGPAYCDYGWYPPFSLTLGWWGGRWGRHRSHGWGVGLGWHGGWCW